MIALVQDRVRLPIRVARCAVAGHIALIGTFKEASHLCFVVPIGDLGYELVNVLLAAQSVCIEPVYACPLEKSSSSVLWLP